jgi:hypothetical protein
MISQEACLSSMTTLGSVDFWLLAWDDMLYDYATIIAIAIAILIKELNY